MADDEFTAVETYLRSNQYPKGMTKGKKANLRRKCKNNFKFETGMLYYKKNGIDEASKWKICVRSDDEKKADTGVMPFWNRRYVHVRINFITFQCPWIGL